uniref:Uncharacterized protein n=2 Tax=Oryza sativa subsp. japonica TaxID=39947 RepID=Q2R9P8_ORYSJ|nr:hypothetical protein LOC_Os11g08010 [Oryza sativa Japonica Group]AAX96196.1 hypothetical protein [Oryza sativa Japonica Group]ABA91805.1 hypothetical protein LOC_Os11g08009 [Oryza sativa Japonica Group]
MGWAVDYNDSSKF